MTTRYSRYYFREEGNISKWRNPRRVPIDDKAWKADLMTHQSKMSALSSDLAFEIDHIEDQIGVRAVVHVNQPDPRFGGRGNPNLSGTAVSRIAGNNNWYIVEAEKKTELLLTGIPPAKRAKNVAYNGLRKGKSYRLLKGTPRDGHPPELGIRFKFGTDNGSLRQNAIRTRRSGCPSC